MTYKTHKQFSICFALVGAMLLNIGSVSVINYYLTIPIMLMASKWGALMPDVDHIWQNVKEKNTLNWIINKLIHITGGTHRSWQTHSLDICTYFTIGSYIVPKILYHSGKIGVVDKEVMMLLMIGVATGWISHLFSDAMTSGGIRIFFFSKRKVSIVPKKIGKLKFNTGGQWEEFCYNLVGYLNKLLGIFSIIFPFREVIIGYIASISNLT